jgi:hypothetical protein
MRSSHSAPTGLVTTACSQSSAFATLAASKTSGLPRAHRLRRAIAADRRSRGPVGRFPPRSRTRGADRPRWSRASSRDLRPGARRCARRPASASRGRGRSSRQPRRSHATSTRRAEPPNVTRAEVPPGGGSPSVLSPSHSPVQSVSRASVSLVGVRLIPPPPRAKTLSVSVLRGVAGVGDLCAGAPNDRVGVLLRADLAFEQQCRRCSAYAAVMARACSVCAANSAMLSTPPVRSAISPRLRRRRMA